MKSCAALLTSLALRCSSGPSRSPVIQGQDGVSRKAEGAGHASHYFSLPRLLTTGSIALNGKTYQVEGTSWIDHEFFTGSMAANETGLGLVERATCRRGRAHAVPAATQGWQHRSVFFGQLRGCEREVSIFVRRGFRNDAGGRNLDQPGDQGDLSSALARLHSAPDTCSWM